VKPTSKNDASAGPIKKSTDVLACLSGRTAGDGGDHPGSRREGGQGKGNTTSSFLELDILFVLPDTEGKKIVRKFLPGLRLLYWYYSFWTRHVASSLVGLEISESHSHLVASLSLSLSSFSMRTCNRVFPEQGRPKRQERRMKNRITNEIDGSDILRCRSIL
jgi:hypothetical protein